MTRWYDNPGWFRAKFRGLVSFLDQPASVGLVLFASLAPLMTLILLSIFTFLAHR